MHAVFAAIRMMAQQFLYLLGLGVRFELVASLQSARASHGVLCVVLSQLITGFRACLSVPMKQ